MHTNEPLLFMSLGVYVNGDATITSAMSEADCNDFGWENGWGSDPIIDDPNGWVCLNGLCWAADANDIVGYFKFRYHSGQVAVYIDQENSLAANWGNNFTFSTESLLFGEIVLPPLKEPNEPTAVFMQSPANSSGPSRGESESFAGWSQHMEMLEMLDSEPIVYVIDSNISENQVWDANDIYYIVGDPNNSYIVDVNLKDLKFAAFDACKAMMLKIDSQGKLVESPNYNDVRGDLSIALLQRPWDVPCFVFGWAPDFVSGLTSQGAFSTDMWKKLAEGKTLAEAISYAYGRAPEEVRNGYRLQFNGYPSNFKLQGQ